MKKACYWDHEEKDFSQKCKFGVVRETIFILKDINASQDANQTQERRNPKAMNEKIPWVVYFDDKSRFNIPLVRLFVKVIDGKALLVKGYSLTLWLTHLMNIGCSSETKCFLWSLHTRLGCRFQIGWTFASSHRINTALTSLPTLKYTFIYVLLYLTVWSCEGLSLTRRCTSIVSFIFLWIFGDFNFLSNLSFLSKTGQLTSLTGNWIS
jgi:hypothetical protein